MVYNTIQFNCNGITMTKRTKTELATQIANNLEDNTSGLITPEKIRNTFTDVSDSLLFWDDSTPSSATENCTVGEIKLGSTDFGGGVIVYYLYACVATNTWRRTELSSF